MIYEKARGLLLYLCVSMDLYQLSAAIQPLSLLSFVSFLLLRELEVVSVTNATKKTTDSKTGNHDKPRFFMFVYLLLPGC